MTMEGGGMTADTEEIGDRRVHAVTPLLGIEVVRYDRAGKWYIEDGDRREQVTLDEAVDYCMVVGAEPRFGLAGGSAFDRRLRAALSGREASDGR